LLRWHHRPAFEHLTQPLADAVAELAHELDLVVVNAVSADAITVDLEQVRKVEVQRTIRGRDLTMWNAARTS
jgi:hypothetical protein